MIKCPLCDASIDFDEDELDEGDELTCDECGEMIRVTSTSPLEMEGVDDDDEEEDDDFDEDEDDDFGDEEDGEEADDEDDDDDDWR